MTTLDDMARQLFLTQGNGQPGAIGQLMENPAFNMGVGLMAAGAPNPTHPTNFGTAFGRANEYAGERQSQALMNDVRRQALSQAAMEQKGLADFMSWKQENPDASPDQIMAKAYETMPQLSAKAMISSMFDPTAQLTAELRQGQLEQVNQAIASGKLEASQAKKDTLLTKRYLSVGVEALEDLAGIPGGASVLNDAQFRGWMRAGLNEPATRGLAVTALKTRYGMTEDQALRVVSLAEKVNKARTNIGSMKGGAVQSQANRMAGLGEDAGLDVQLEVFKDELGATDTLIQENGWASAAPKVEPSVRAGLPRADTPKKASVAPAASKLPRNPRGVPSFASDAELNQAYEAGLFTPEEMKTLGAGGSVEVVVGGELMRARFVKGQ